MAYILPDVSEHQGHTLDASYPRSAVIFRGAFGNAYQDLKFLANAAAARRLWDAGKLTGGAVIYQVPLSGLSAQSQYNFLWRLIGPTVPDWLTGVMIDAETWRGTSYPISGDHSSLFNTLYGMHAHKLGSWDACKGYGNNGDMAAIWPHRDARCEWIEANYGPSIPTRTGKIGQQYTNGSTRWAVPKGLPRSTPPFGACDHNVFPGISNGDQFRKAWGRKTWLQLHPVTPSPVVPPVHTVPHPQPAPHYDPKKNPRALVSNTGEWAAFLADDGRIDVRNNGHHVRYL